MHISDKLGQYNQNVKNGTEELHSAQGAQKLVSSAGDLAAGNIFEGTVNSVKNGKVTLALGDGQVITARLDTKLPLRPGSSMFFQVKSNDGVSVAIRPYTGVGNASNPILLNALTAAHLPVTERSLTMVDMMMKEQMPIDRQSVLNMTKIVSGNPQVNVGTLVQMTKMGIPVTKEMAVQFENYLADRGTIMNELDTAMNQLTAALSSETISSSDAFTLNGQILDILKQEGMVLQEEALLTGKGEAATETLQGFKTGIGAAVGGEADAESVANAQLSASGKTAGANASVDAVGTAQDLMTGIKNTASGEQNSSTAAQNASDALQNVPTQVLGDVLNETQLSNLTRLLQNVPTLAGNTQLFENPRLEEIFVDTMQEDEMGEAIKEQLIHQLTSGSESTVNKNLTVQDFLREVNAALGENSQFGFSGMKRLFAGNEYQLLLRHELEQQWTLKPQDLMGERKVSKLYEKLTSQMEQMENVMKMADVSSNSFSQTAADIKSNIAFMNQINQMYAYVQIPLKLSGQNANSDLYVYTNKKNLLDPDIELTAFLHLDLEQLGTTDVSIKMKQKQVTTNFYLADDASYRLMEKHLPILEKRLKQKGYHCSISITNEEKKVNLVEDFLKKDMPHKSTLHRYSFDVRA